MSANPAVRTRVLVVEDEPAIADTICYALATDGFEPDWRSTGAAALEALAGTDPALIILEYRVLKLLVSRPGRVFTRDDILQQAWDEPDASYDRTVDAHIKTIRAKLKAVAADVDPIRTHRGEGYLAARGVRREA